MGARTEWVREGPSAPPARPSTRSPGSEPDFGVPGDSWSFSTGFLVPQGRQKYSNHKGKHLTE